MWDSGVRQALKRAAAAEGCDFQGFGPDSLRRANITWRQEVGGSSIETSKIAGHASTAITEEYTFVELDCQDDLTRRIQDKRAKAARKAEAGPNQPPVWNYWRRNASARRRRGRPAKSAGAR